MDKNISIALKLLKEKTGISRLMKYQIHMVITLCAECELSCAAVGIKRFLVPVVPPPLLSERIKTAHPCSLGRCGSHVLVQRSGSD